MTDHAKTSSHSSKLSLHNPYLKAWGIVACGTLFYLYQFMIRVSPNIMNEELMKTLSIDAGGLGLIISLYYWTYVAMQLPMGIMMDRIGPRGFLCGACLISAFACFVFGNTSSVMIASLSRLLLGAASACGLLGAIKLGTIWLKPKHLGLAVGMTILFGTLGGSLGQAPLRMILDLIGVEHTMELLAFLGIFFSFLIYKFVKNHPEEDNAELGHSAKDVYTNEHPLRDIMRLLRSPQAWIVAVYGMLMYVPVTTMNDAWGAEFVKRACDTSSVIAGSVTTTMLLGAAIGSPCFAVLSDILKNRRIPMLIGSLITTTLFFYIFMRTGVSLSVMYVLFFIVGFAYTAKCLTFASICEIMPRNISGVSVAFVNMVVMTSGIIFHSLIGELLDFHWSGLMEDGIRLYSESDYRFALMVIPISLLISIFLLYFMWETHPESNTGKKYRHLMESGTL